MPDIFVDSSAFIALEAQDDQYQTAARQYQMSLVSQPVRFVTTNFVLDETYTWLRRRASHAQAVAFGNNIRQSARLIVHRITADQEDAAWDIFVRYEDKDFSYTDCTSFVVMKQLGVTTAFAFDRHFDQFGFARLPNVTL